MISHLIKHKSSLFIRTLGKALSDPTSYKANTSRMCKLITFFIWRIILTLNKMLFKVYSLKPNKKYHSV